jgi:hypothetical protein
MIGRALLIMLLAYTAVMGQAAEAIVSGRVQLPGGGPVGSIPVTMNSVSTNNGILLQAQTNGEGYFRFENVRPGQYVVFAAAALSPLIPGTENASPGIVLSPRAIPARRVGTFYPGTADASQATAITVAASSRVDNINFELASSPLNWSGPQFQLVPAKIIVEGGGTPSFHSDQFGLAFSDASANISLTATFKDGQQKPATSSTRIERTQEPFLISAIVPMPAFPAGEFRLLLPQGDLRVGYVAPIKETPRPASHVVPPAKNYYYIKSMTFGATDLMKELMPVRGAIRDILVITLARCTDTTKEILCR